MYTAYHGKKALYDLAGDSKEKGCMIVDGTLAACPCSLAITTNCMRMPTKCIGVPTITSDRMHIHLLVRCTFCGHNHFLSISYATPQQAPLE